MRENEPAEGKAVGNGPIAMLSCVQPGGEGGYCKLQASLSCRADPATVPRKASGRTKACTAQKLNKASAAGGSTGRKPPPFLVCVYGGGSPTFHPFLKSGWVEGNLWCLSPLSEALGELLVKLVKSEGPMVCHIEVTNRLRDCWAPQFKNSPRLCFAWNWK